MHGPVVTVQGGCCWIGAASATGADGRGLLTSTVRRVSRTTQIAGICAMTRTAAKTAVRF